MVTVAKLWESGKLDLDAPVQKYVPGFPEKTVEGEKVTITTRHLLSHLSGIRHYERKQKAKKEGKCKEKGKPKEKIKSQEITDETSKTGKSVIPAHKAAKNVITGDKIEKDVINCDKKSKDVINSDAPGDAKFKEFYLKKKFSSIEESLKLFQDDPLFHKPGSKFLYTTHGWTLVSAVVEGASGMKFTVLLQALLKDIGLDRTYLDENDPLIYNRARYYVKNKKGRLINAPYVDNSYKWAGGGLLSTVGDLLKFGNVMLYSYQCPAPKIPVPGECQIPVPGECQSTAENNQAPNIPSLNADAGSSYSIGFAQVLPGYLRPDTVKHIWTPVEKTQCSWDKSAYYGMGWSVVPAKHEHGQCRHQQYFVSHTGGAIGASSVLLILPRPIPNAHVGHDEKELKKTWPLPQGVSVAIISNTGSAGLYKTSVEIAQLFDQVEFN